MLNFASHELDDWRETNQTFEQFPAPSKKKIETVKILADKIVIPVVSAEIARPRLSAHLKKSLRNFSATLVTGRAGTGKTAFAADFIRQNAYSAAWYKADTTDTDWKVFLQYLSESLRPYKSEAVTEAGENKQSTNAESQSVTESLAAQFAVLDTEKPLLVVLDDLHSVFDADWFGEFFNGLLSLPAPNVRLLLLARAAPSFPLWRLRSKQVLDVMDEKLMAFTLEETIKLFQKYKLPRKAARLAHKRAYGRIAKLKEVAGNTKSG
ncbi:MAG TPA: AAA family ATPase [Pyrinomonadaceae bacterium]|nr:AAA family ATPase [Pyrinomonadaceae bacterium]